MLTKTLLTLLLASLPLASFADELTAAKRNDIKALLEITGFKTLPLSLANLQASNLAPMIRKADPKFPEKGMLIIRDTVLQVLLDNAEKPNGLLESLTQSTHPIYSHDEIKDILRFYGSATGKKLLESQGKLSQENQQAAFKWAMSLEKDMKTRVTDALAKEGLKLPDPPKPAAAPAKAAPSKPAPPAKPAQAQ
jgi:hypothetical protein